MEEFSIGEVYIDGDGLKTVDINPLPYNICSFDCVFCPLGRTKIKTDKMVEVEGRENFNKKLSEFLLVNEVDKVFINPDGESLANSEIFSTISLIKEKSRKVRLLSNGYILNYKEYREALALCDEVIGELCVTSEKNFQLLQRPMDGYTLENYVRNMKEFKENFKGKFIIDITILKGHSDSLASAECFRRMVNEIKPDEVLVNTPSSLRFNGIFTVDVETLQEIDKVINK